MHKLMVKEHLDTNLKYLCYTQKSNHDEYLGSGKYWKKHLKKHGCNIKTTLLFESDNYEEFKKVALEYSNKFDVVNDRGWANEISEQGEGGNTVSNKMWITDGTNEKYILKTEEIPSGWNRGRSNSCKFKDKNFQRDLSNRVDRIKAGKSIKKAWDEGRINRDHSKCGSKGDNNVSKRPEVRQKIKESAMNRPRISCLYCRKEATLSPGFYRFHMENCKLYD